MKEQKNTETEKKFLIRYPGEDLLSCIPTSDRSFISQTYLLSENGVTARVRCRKYASGIKYTKTEKRRITDMSCFEDERELTEEEYLLELKKADPARHTIEKERILLREGFHIFEIDLYPFWKKTAIMEIELQSEDEEFTLPHGITVIKDVTSDKSYKNASLALKIPKEE